MVKLVRHQGAVSDEVFVRWLIFFVALVFFVWVLWHNDLIQSVIRTDPTRLSLVIFFIFVCGTIHCAMRSVYLSARQREMDAMVTRPEALRFSADSSRVVFFDNLPLPSSPLTEYLADIARAKTATKADASHLSRQDKQLSDINAVLIEKMTGSHETGWFFAQLLVKLGLLGTVIGFIIMLSSISATVSYDAAHVPELFSGMTGGMRVALNTTLVGLMGTILLSFQYLMIDRGADHLLGAVTHFAATELSAEPSTESAGLAKLAGGD